MQICGDYRDKRHDYQHYQCFDFMQGKPTVFSGQKHGNTWVDRAMEKNCCITVFQGGLVSSAILRLQNWLTGSSAQFERSVSEYLPLIVSIL